MGPDETLPSCGLFVTRTPPPAGSFGRAATRVKNDTPNNTLCPQAASGLPHTNMPGFIQFGVYHERGELHSPKMGGFHHTSYVISV